MPKGGIRPICSVANCGQPHSGKGYCKVHYARWRLENSPVCKIDGCTKHAEKRGWCSAHYYRYRTHGTPLGGGRSPGSAAKFYDDTVRNYSNKATCLRWPFSLSNGYPFLKVYNNAHNVYVHRLACEQTHGPSPSPAHEAAHACGNSWCCNPLHLRWATASENQYDKVLHGTDLRGSKHPLAKLTEDAVREIRKLHGKVTQSSLAKRFGVSPSVISRVSRGDRSSWSWLKD
jgi:hypothetical protein